MKDIATRRIPARLAVLAALAVALALVAVPLGAVATHAGNHPGSQGNVNQQAPTVAAPNGPDEDGSTPGNQVVPSAGGQKGVTLTITVSDSNGHNDIDTVTVTVYEPDNSTVEVGQGSASKTSGNGAQATYEYTFNMDYWDDPATGSSTYSVKAVATDRDGLSDTGWYEFNYEELAALSMDTSMVYLNPDGSSGTAVSPGGSTHSNPSSVTISNDGNVQIDLQYSGTDLTNATNGESIGVSNVHWDTNSSFPWENSFSTSTQTNTTFDLAKGSSSTKTVYLNIHVPNVPEAEYTGTLTMAAVKG